MACSTRGKAGCIRGRLGLVEELPVVDFDLDFSFLPPALLLSNSEDVAATCSKGSLPDEVLDAELLVPLVDEARGLVLVEVATTEASNPRETPRRANCASPKNTGSNIATGEACSG